MNKRFPAVFMSAALLMAPVATLAEQHTVNMKNSGEKGAMVFEPGYLEAEPGDTVRFVAESGAHNSVSTEVPEGAQSWSGGINEEIEVTLKEEGVYVYKCTPHAMMNMAGVIQVGEPTNYDEAKATVEQMSSEASANKDRLSDYFSHVEK